MKRLIGPVKGHLAGGDRGEENAVFLLPWNSGVENEEQVT